MIGSEPIQQCQCVSQADSDSDADSTNENVVITGDGWCGLKNPSRKKGMVTVSDHMDTSRITRERVTDPSQDSDTAAASR